MKISDVEFLNRDLGHFPLRVIYQYRTSLLRKSVRDRVRQLAADRNVLIANANAREFGAKLLEESVWAELPPVVLCEIEPGGKLVGSPMDVIAEEATRAFCLILPAGHALTSSMSWEKAAARSLVLEEPMVSTSNLLPLADFLASWGGYKGVSRNDLDAAVKLLARALGEGNWDLCKTAQMLDCALLTPRAIEDRLKVRRSRGDVLNECLKDFLDLRDAVSMRRLLALLADKAGGRQISSNADVLRQLYKTTEKIVAQRDKRYGRRRTGGAQNFSWALHLMHNESRLLSAPCIASIERICREFMSVVDHNAWLSDPVKFRSSFGSLMFPDQGNSIHKARRLVIEALLSSINSMVERPQWADSLIGEILIVSHDDQSGIGDVAAL